MHTIMQKYFPLKYNYHHKLSFKYLEYFLMIIASIDMLKSTNRMASGAAEGEERGVVRGGVEGGVASTELLLSIQVNLTINTSGRE